MSGLNLQLEKRGASLRMQVEDKIRQAIASGHFGPGQKLIERELCEMIGVGRTSVREALRQLEAEGLIVTHPHRGPSVNAVSLEEAKQLYAVRGLLEGFSGEEFAKNGTDEEMVSLGKASEEFAQAVDAHLAGPSDQTRDNLIAVKTLFYNCLMEGSHNVFVQQALTQLHNRITLLRVTSMTQPGRLLHSVSEINDIVQAIRARDAGLAGARCRFHIARAAETAVAYLERSKEN